MVTSLQAITTIKIIILVVITILFIILFGKDILKYLKKRIKGDKENGKEIDQKGA